MIWTGAPRLAGKEWKSAATDEKIAHKAFDAFEIKDEAKGEIEAIIATFGVIDKDGDIVQPGSIKAGSTVAISGYGHSALFGEKPVGKGTIVIDGNKAIVKGQLFLEMADARDTLVVLKGMGKDQQWSWGFRVLGSEVPSEEQRKQGAYRIITKTETFEASPVIRGAGVGTRTLSAKSEAAPPDPAPVPAPTAAEAAKDQETPEQKAEREAREQREREESDRQKAAEAKALQETMDLEAKRFQLNLQRHSAA